MVYVNVPATGSVNSVSVMVEHKLIRPCVLCRTRRTVWSVVGLVAVYVGSVNVMNNRYVHTFL